MKQTRVTLVITGLLVSGIFATTALTDVAVAHHREGHTTGKPSPSPTESPSPTPSPAPVSVTLDVRNPLLPGKYQPCTVTVLEGDPAAKVFEAAKSAGCIDSYEIRYRDGWPTGWYLACVDGICEDLVYAFLAYTHSYWYTSPWWSDFSASEGSMLRAQYAGRVCTFAIDTYACLPLF